MVLNEFLISIAVTRQGCLSYRLLLHHFCSLVEFEAATPKCPPMPRVTCLYNKDAVYLQASLDRLLICLGP